MGVPGGFCSGMGETAGCPLGEAAGVAPGPGWVPGIFSEFGPSTDVGFGVPAAVAGPGETAGAGDAPEAGACAGVSIGFAGAGFFDAKS